MIKKIGAILIILFLVGCHSIQEEQPTLVYSFKGENEGLSISNGVIVLSPTQQILYGGELKNNRGDLLNLLNYSMEFFILSDDGKDVLLVSSASDMTESDRMSISEAKLLPSRSGGTFTTNIQNNIKNNFYFELTITKTNGDQENYQIKLDVTEVTKTIIDK